MQLRRVAVLGGGPGGLYAARLLMLAQPGCEVVVHEQGERDTTFGFGVEFGLPVLSAATAGAHALLRALDLPAVLPGAGSLLAALPSRA